MEERIYIRGQVSEVVSTGILLTLSGGFQDAYTYYCRGGMSTNTQTGNIVFMGSHLASREWGMAFHCMAPVTAFACGVYMAEHTWRQHKHSRQFHWRQMVVAVEIILLFLVGFIPQSMSMAVNVAVSFACAMQVSISRRTRGSPYTTTMRIGNLRSGMEHFYTYRHTKGPGSRGQYIRYYEAIVIFLVGTVLRTVLTAQLAEKAIQVSRGLLLISLLIMFLQEDIGERERVQ